MDDGGAERSWDSGLVLVQVGGLKRGRGQARDGRRFPSGLDALAEGTCRSGQHVGTGVVSVVSPRLDGQYDGNGQGPDLVPADSAASAWDASTRLAVQSTSY